MIKNKQMIYRILAQTETVTITAQTHETTEDKALEDAKKHILSPEVLESGGYRPFVLQPVCTSEEWRMGNVNFCPRCGHRLEDIDSNYYRGECFECNVELNIDITAYDEESEDDL